MIKQALNLKVEPRQIKRLDDLARQHGLNRSELMRLVLDNIQIVERPVLGAQVVAPTVTINPGRWGKKEMRA
jgi:hypothetical protein